MYLVKIFEKHAIIVNKIHLWDVVHKHGRWANVLLGFKFDGDNIALDSGLWIMKTQYNRSYKSCMKMFFRAKVKMTIMTTLELLKLYQKNVT